MENPLEADYRDFIQIQGLKDENDVARAAAALAIDEEALYEFISQRVLQLEEQGFDRQKVGEYLGTLLLFGYWLRGVKGDTK